MGAGQQGAMARCACAVDGLDGAIRRDDCRVAATRGGVRKPATDVRRKRGTRSSWRNHWTMAGRPDSGSVNGLRAKAGQDRPGRGMRRLHLDCPMRAQPWPMA